MDKILGKWEWNLIAPLRRTYSKETVHSVAQQFLFMPYILENNPRAHEVMTKGFGCRNVCFYENLETTKCLPIRNKQNFIYL